MNCLNCDSPHIVVMNLGQGFNCGKCRFGWFPEDFRSMAYLMPRGEDRIWHDVP